MAVALRWAWAWMLLAALLPHPAAAQTYCGGMAPTIFCDDFGTDQGWTASGSGLQQAPSATGWSLDPNTLTLAYNANAGQTYNPNDWHDSANGCLDANAKYVGVSTLGFDLGYISPEPFGFWTGTYMVPPGSIPQSPGTSVPNYLPWYEVTNTLTSPLIDARGLSVSTIGYKVWGSSEDTSNVAYDRLYANVVVQGAGTFNLGQYSGVTWQSACNAFTFNAPWLSGQKFQFEFVFVQDSNTDSTYLAPCSPEACPTLPTPVCFADPTDPTGRNQICFKGGMGWYVDDVFVKRAALRPGIVPDLQLQLCSIPATFAFHATDLMTPPFTDVTAWSWAFGDSATSNQQDPTHTYSAASIYTVALTASLNDGTSRTSTGTVTVADGCFQPGSYSSHIDLFQRQVFPPGTPHPYDGVDARVAGADSDQDGVTDRSDDCPLAANPNQVDMDGDGAGDACDRDLDGDGAPNVLDACPSDPRIRDALPGARDPCATGVRPQAADGTQSQPLALGAESAVPPAPAVQGRPASSVTVTGAAANAFWAGPAVICAVLLAGAIWAVRRR